MDVYTAASRLSRFRNVAEGPVALGQHGLIGDGLTCALVGVDGSIDWLCLPRFDSPSVFGGILDPERGGVFRISPVRRPFESLQAYDTATAVLQTLFRVPDQGVVCVSDFMPWTDDARSSMHEVHRLVEVREGEVELEIVFDPRFDYGRRRTRVEIAEHGAVATGAEHEHVCVAVNDGLRFRARGAGGVVARWLGRPGQRTWAILSWRAPQPEPVAAYRPFEHLRATRTFWRSWAGRLAYDGPWRHDVLRSALTLKLLQYAPTGAMVAAPTTSLPVAPEGDRNWDYRYSWVRDSAMAIRAMSLLGYRDEARGFFHFVRDTIDHRGRLDLMVSVDGSDVPDESVLDHLSGHAGAGPVRLGNAARDQLQLDITGAVLDATWVYERSGGTITLRLWRQLRALVDEAVRRRGEPDDGIWEPRAAPVHHVHSKLMTWVAVDRAIRLASLFGGDPAVPLWTRTRDAIHAEILERGTDPARGGFVGAYGGEAVDASLLLFPVYGFLPASDPRVVATLERVMRDLGEGRFLRRYRTHDGLASDEGAFVLCGFWLAEALALAGRVDEALRVFHNHLEAANHVGLLSEEVAVERTAALGNFPQSFSHLGLIQAAARLDLALRLRDEGAERPPRHAIDPPLA